MSKKQKPGEAGSGSAGKETAAEKIGYRWMMRCLRALDKAPSGRLYHKFVVYHVGGKHYPKGIRAFIAECTAAAEHAIAMLRNGSFDASCAYMEPGDSDAGLQVNERPRSYRVVFTVKAAQLP